MDEYGTQEATAEDYKFLATRVFSRAQNIVFSYSKDRITAYVVMICPVNNHIGVLPFGGNPDGCHLVSVLLHGSFWFKFEVGKQFHADYVGEKLQLNKTGAEQIAELLTGICDAMVWR